MKRWKLGFLAVILALSLTACGAEGNDKPAADQSVSQEADAVTDGAEESNDAQEDASTEEKEAAKESSAEKETSTEEEQEKPVLTETFQSLFAKYDIKAGTCLSDYMITNKNCESIIKTHFNSITFENHLKPDAILDLQESKAKGELVVKFNATTEKLLKWCKDNGMAMRGHTLVWYSQTPNWIFYEDFDTKKSLVSREVMLERMDSYISQVFTLLEEKGYLESFYAYDVVNEAWMEDGTKRDCLWLKTIGEDYLWYAFYYADKYAPEYIDLYYNDYNEQFKTETLYNFVQTLKDEDGNYLIDGVGFQAHLYTEDDLDTYFNTVERLGSLGLKVNLTELDVCLGTWQNIKPATEENLKAQGQYYYNLINGLLQRVDEGKVKMDSLTFWGFADGLSWRKERNPLLYNKFYQPKYAFYGALQMKEYAGFDE